ncbi:MAG: translation initiation factor IF-2 subunit alpha [Nitrososphaerota archaeon]|jgi:translation initiation factor 2 subunit 1|nr:translation initiation factor IF-2 subunit alpha [Nitrososphaerota archaeon]
MYEQKTKWPEPGDLVMTTIKTVMDYGVYANLDEYNKTGFLHISEISSARIRNIRDFVRENQKLVLKVLRVDYEKGHIDLSLRRVTKRERIEKVKSWKKDRKGEALLYVVAERTGIPRDEAYQKVGTILEENYGLYDGFEKTLKEGITTLTQLNIPEEIAKIILEVVEERIKVKTVKVWGILEIRCSRPNGVRCIQNAFINAKKTHTTKNTKIDFSVIAAPKYRIEVLAENWKQAEEILNKTSETVIANIDHAGGYGTFKREK